MFYAALLASLPLLATASVISSLEERQSDSCNTGALLCCQSLVSPNSPSVGTIAGLLGIIISPTMGGLVGIGCTPISLLDITGPSCSGQIACCTNNSFNGIIALGCTPVNINL